MPTNFYTRINHKKLKISPCKKMSGSQGSCFRKKETLKFSYEDYFSLQKLYLKRYHTIYLHNILPSVVLGNKLAKVVYLRFIKYIVQL